MIQVYVSDVNEYHTFMDSVHYGETARQVMELDRNVKKEGEFYTMPLNAMHYWNEVFEFVANVDDLSTTIKGRGIPCDVDAAKVKAALLVQDSRAGISALVRSCLEILAAHSPDGKAHWMGCFEVDPCGGAAGKKRA